MSELEDLVTRTLRARAQEATMTVNSSRSHPDLQVRLDEEDRRRSRRTTLIALSAAAAIAVAAGGGIALWNARTPSAPPAAPVVASTTYPLDGGPLAIVKNEYASDLAFWVVLRDASSVVSWNSVTGTTESTIALPGTPVAATFPLPYVVVLVKTGDLSRLVVVDQAIKEIVGDYPLEGDVVSVKGDASGKNALVLDATSGTVSSIDLKTGAIAARSSELSAPSSLTSLVDGSRYLGATDSSTSPVAVALGRDLVLLDPASLTLVARYPLPSAAAAVTHSSSGDDPWYVSLADGTVLTTPTGGGTLSTLGRYQPGGVAWKLGGSSGVWVVGGPSAQLVDASTGAVVLDTDTDQTGGARYLEGAGDGWTTRPDAAQLVQLPAR